MYTTSHEDRKLKAERDACDAAIRWGAEAEVSIEEVLLVAERTLADARRRLKTELVLPPGARYDLTTTAGRLSDEVETLRNRLDEDLADLRRIERERRVYDRKRAEDHAAALPAHLMDLGTGMAKALREEGRCPECEDGRVFVHDTGKTAPCPRCNPPHSAPPTTARMLAKEGR